MDLPAHATWQHAVFYQPKPVRTIGLLMLALLSAMPLAAIFLWVSSLYNFVSMHNLHCRLNALKLFRFNEASSAARHINIRTSH